MSFYGNVSNASKTQLVFDRIYANRAAMDEAVGKGNGTDGVFINRLVLIEYDDNTHSRRQGFLKARPDGNIDSIYQIFAEEECSAGTQFTYSETNRDGYGIAFGDIVYVRWPLTGEIFYFQCWDYYGENTNVAGFKKIYSANMDDNTKVTDYLLNYYADKQSYPDMPYNGYDSTIWKKSIEGGREIYQMIGSLNSDAPHFSVVADAPSINPMAPHMGENSTNQNYTLHIPTNWGFKVKPAETYVDDKGNERMLSDESVVYSYTPLDENNDFREGERVEEVYNGAIFYNKAGFDSDVISRIDESQIPNVISVSPTGKSGRKYFNHGGDESIEKEDLQELKIHLPALGNAISDMWDIVYGNKTMNNGSLKRNKDLAWNSTKGIRLVKAQDKGSGFEYDPYDVECIAGCINSVHDLMGMILTNAPAENQTKEEALEMAQTGRIYYGPLGQTTVPGFYFKDIGYKFDSFEDLGIDRTEYISGREYHTLTQFEPDVYYTYVDKDFYCESGNTPTEDTLYYKLGGYREVNVKEWQEKDPESGEIIYAYYKADNGDYIQDSADSPSRPPTDTYYYISPTQATIPIPTWDQIKTEIWNPKPPVNKTEEIVPTDWVKQTEIDTYKITAYYSGYFYMKKDESGKNIALIALKDSDTYDANKQYYYIDKYVAAENYDAEGESNESLYFINGSQELIPFITVVENQDNKYEYSTILYSYRINLLPYTNNTYYTILAEELADGSIQKGYRLLQSQSTINNEEIYYTLEATPQTGLMDNPQGGAPIPTYFYRSGQFFMPYNSKDYILIENEKYNPALTYLILLDKNGNELVVNLETGLVNIAAEEVKFYLPGEYYYRSKELGEDVLDNSLTMKTSSSPEVDPDYISEDRVYYTPHLAYVVEDKLGVLAQGSVWDKSENPPSGVVLGARTEIYQWTELKGFARTLNTIHGLILNINKFFKFNDSLTRDNDTIQGCLNSLNDLLNSFDTLNPGDLVIVDEYGRLTGADFVTDNWISATVNDSLKDSTVSITHEVAQEKSGNTIGFSANAIPKFGEVFKGFGFDIDAKGHVIANSVKNYSITLPNLAVSDGTAGNVVTGLAISADGQSVVANKSNIGTLAITGYVSATAASALSNEDTLNSALGKLEFRTKALEDNVAKWNAGEANVQADWNTTDNTSDAYILNKPDLTEMVKTTSTFTYGEGQKTIQELMTLVATLETKVAALENPPTTG